MRGWRKDLHRSGWPKLQGYNASPRMFNPCMFSQYSKLSPWKRAECLPPAAALLGGNALVAGIPATKHGSVVQCIVQRPQGRETSLSPQFLKLTQ